VHDNRHEKDGNGLPLSANPMTRSELVLRLTEANPHLTQGDVETVVISIFAEIAAALSRGNRVELRGFGAFTITRREARIGHNPRSGASVPVSEKCFPHFKPGKGIRDRLNRQSGD
jgi:integration host factor subunit beta